MNSSSHGQQAVRSRPNRIIEDAGSARLTHPKPPEKYSDAWVRTISPAVSLLPGIPYMKAFRAVKQPRLTQRRIYLRCAWAARLVESCAWRGSRRVTLRFNSPDADCLHIIYLWRVMGSRNSDYGFSELRIEPYNVFGSLAQPDKRIGGLMSTIAKLFQRSAAPAAPLILGPLNATSLRDQAYALVWRVIEQRCV